MFAEGFPAYTTSGGWLGYPDEKVRQLSLEAYESPAGSAWIERERSKV